MSMLNGLCIHLPKAYIRYSAIDIVLNVNYDAYHSVLPIARNRISGFYHLTDNPQPHHASPINGPLLVEYKTLKHAATSAVETGISTLFQGAKTTISIRRMLITLFYPQPPTPIKVDTITTNNFVHHNITQKHSKSWDMRFY